jgi:hypothetical protein
MNIIYGISDKQFRFFSRLVVESLIDFQRKVAKIVETIGFTFNDFYLVIHPFKFSSMNGVIAVIEDAIAIAIQHPGKAVQRWMI